MRRFRPAAFAILLLLAGCWTTRVSLQEQAAAVPRLTQAMHAAALRMHYPGDTNLPPVEVQQLFAQAAGEQPDLSLFKRDGKRVTWCQGQPAGEIILLLGDPRTGVARFEDASCTPSLDRRWHESNSPPRDFTLSHPQTCGCARE